MAGVAIANFAQRRAGLVAARLPGAAMTAFATTADGTRIAYEVHGAGSPALVLVHGWCCDRHYWKAQVPLLAARRQVVALDLAGHGESGAGRSDWSMAAFGGDVAGVVEHLALTSVVLIGHSMGADVTLETARRLKGRIRGLVWVDEHSQFSRFKSAAEVREKMKPFRSDFVQATRDFVRGLFPASADPALVEHVAADMSSAPAEMALAAMEATWNYARNVPAALSELRLPVVTINAQDSSTDLDSMRRHGVDVVLMPGVGHFPMLEKPAEFTRILSRILEHIPA